MFKKFTFQTPVKKDLPEASGSSPALVVAKKSAPPGQPTDTSPPPGHQTPESPPPRGHQSDVSPPVSAASRPSVSPMEAFLDRSAGFKKDTSRKKKLTKQGKGKQPARVNVKSHSDSEEAEEVEKRKKIKWLRSYKLTSVLEQVLKAITNEKLPLKSLSFLKDVLDPMIEEQKVEFEFDGKEGRKKIRDRADRLKTSVLNIISHYENTLTLPDGLCGDEATDVCAILVQILELSQEYDGNVRSVTTIYPQASGENLDMHMFICSV